MKNKYIGETVIWEVNIKDENGTALTGETPSLSVSDFGGTVVLTATGTHGTLGSYSHIGVIGATWGTGPSSYVWRVAGTSGSAIEVSTNELNILAGTVEPTGYIYKNELPSYYALIEDYYNDFTQDKITARYNYINRMLESLNISAPREKNEDGCYDQSLKDLNAWWAIYDIVQEAQIGRNVGEETPWYKNFWFNGTKIYEDIKAKRIVFKDQISAAESGVQKPTRIAGSSIGTMFNNWDRSYGNPFQGSDYSRTWLVKITGTGTSGNLENSIFQWSENNGVSWTGTGTTAIDWIPLKDEVYIRFDRGTSSGTENIFVIGDKWQFTTNPIARQIGGINTARSY